MSAEASLKIEVKKYLDSIGAWWFMPVPTGFGKRGIPDFVGVYKGRSFVIETKSPGGEPTPWQTKQIVAAHEAGAMVILAYRIQDVTERLG